MFEQLPEEERIILGKWSVQALDALLAESSRIGETDVRMDFLSRLFLGTPYRESTLIGDAETREIFVINLGEVDCFTYIDYLEAMRTAASFAEFKENLKRVRYRSGKVAFECRNHFFTDWSAFPSRRVENVTIRIGGQKTMVAQKVLNRRADGTYLVAGIACVNRTVAYIPSSVIDSALMGKLVTGDYVGVYSEKQGLDVSHTGLIVKQKGLVCLRHASSAKEFRRVVEQDLRKYMENKPGLIILRPRV